MIRKNVKSNEKYLKLINTLNESNKVKNSNKVIIENIRLVYELLADKVIDHKEAIGLIHEIIGYFSKGDYPIMSYSNSSKVKRKK
ncbi:MAG: hypothetical protein ACH34V_09200 [Flavobacterium sp.]|uniref:hypothetical protein n=1 Tax=Flavobacterium sp. TaxID=239 RepID=UPI0037962B27